jgi:hypothetical protein
VGRYGTISVFLYLEGDSSLARKQYAVTIDSTTVLQISPNSSVETVASEGAHLVTLKLPADELWCVGPEAHAQSVVVTQHQRTTLEFHVRCPPVEGNGTFIVMLKDFSEYNCWYLGCDYVARRGRERSKVTFQNMMGVTVVEIADIPFWQKTEIAVPAGVYQITVKPSSNCGAMPPTFLDLIFHTEPPGLTKPFAIHDAETVSQEFALVCE